MVNEIFINNLKPTKIKFIKAFIHKLSNEKITMEITNIENKESTMICCPHCGSIHFVKNGFNKNHRQTYLCKDCQKIFSDTTGTIFSYTRRSYHIWSNFIACEINEMTLGQEMLATGKSKTTCFHMRHKLYSSISEHIRKNTVDWNC